MKRILVLAAALLVAGCASYDGSSLIPNKSTAAEAEALMGVPAERMDRADGGKTLYYMRARQTYAVEVGPNGLVRSVEARRDRQSTRKLVAGTSTTKDVRALYGPPEAVSKLPRLERDVWEYEYRDYEEYRVIWVQFSYDGVVREVMDMVDWRMYAPSGPSLP